MVDLRVKIGKLVLKNPVTVCSGTFGYAGEFSDFVDLGQLGAIVTKTITLEPRMGNSPPRTCETSAGMLNSIGLENPGIESFIAEKMPSLAKIGPAIIVSISSEADPGEFKILAARLNKISAVAAIELNISCPNIKHIAYSVERIAYRKDKREVNLSPKHKYYPLISQNPKATYAVVKSVRRVTKKTLITKLSPNVTDIAEIAQAAEGAGSDAVSLINTLTGMSIDVDKRESRIASITGGLSGPAIRPVAVRMVREVYQRVKIPIIGMGGITDVLSALEFIIAGATAVGVGTANFINPRATAEIITGIKRYLIKNKIKHVKQLIGSLKV